MSRQRSGFFKGIPRFRRSNDDLLYEAAKDSIYRWWWQFLRLSPVLWYARHAGVRPVVPEIARTFEQAGNLHNDDFFQWWRTTGAPLFEEERQPLKLRRVYEEALAEHEFYPEGKSMLVEVPLTVTSRTLVRDFKRLLVQAHDGKRVSVLEQSNAIWKLRTKRYDLQALENQHWILIYRLLYPNVAVWRIGDRLQVAPGLNVRGVEIVSRVVRKTSPHSRMQSTVGRLLYKANRTVVNAEFGVFPDAKPRPEAKKPFGSRRHTDFVLATEGTASEPSAWKQWLKEEYDSELIARIKTKNRIYGLRATNPQTLERLPKFIRGESDLLL